MAVIDFEGDIKCFDCDTNFNVEGYVSESTYGRYHCPECGHTFSVRVIDEEREDVVYKGHI